MATLTYTSAKVGKKNTPSQKKNTLVGGSFFFDYFCLRNCNPFTFPKRQAYVEKV